jgi:hypothetical protein
MRDPTAALFSVLLPRRRRSGGLWIIGSSHRNRRGRQFRSIELVDEFPLRERSARQRI